MKMLMAGDWHSYTFEEPLAVAFEKNGIEVIPFKWFYFFSGSSKNFFFTRFILKFQDKYMFGYLVNKLNKELLKKVELEKPEILFLYRGSHIFSNTLKKIKTKFPETFIISYNNDDPFSMIYPRWMWRHFIKAIPFSDLSLAFRHANIASYYANGALAADLFRGYFNPALHKKLELSKFNTKEFECDTIFIGHYENDGRAQILDFLAGNNVRVKIFGPTGSKNKSGWDDAIKSSNYLQNQNVRYLKGLDYVLAINSAKIGLCFMSKLNNDTYTLRCFEIPACGTALFSEWTEDLANLFEDGVNAVLFKTQEELLERVTYYLTHPEELSLLAARGYEHVHAKGHDVYSRATWLVNKYNLLTEPGKLNPAYV
jgi:spore maturation protein CgeB